MKKVSLGKDEFSRAPLRSLAGIGASLVILVGLGLLMEQFSNGYTQIVVLFALVNTIMAASLSMTAGFTGQFSLGHAGFMAVGAYVSAWLSFRLNIEALAPTLGPVGEIFAYLLLALAAGLAAAVAGVFVGLPSLRLKGDYLAIVTLGFGEIVRVVLLNSEAVGGARGMYGIPGPGSGGSATLSPFLAQFALLSILAVATLSVLWRLIYSPRGRAFLSVREDEIAAESMGVNVTATKIYAFVISAFFAGLGGAAFAHTVKYLNPSTFSFAKSVDIIIMVVLGGLGSLTGAVLGALIITILPELILRPLQEFTGIDLRMVLYALTLVLVMILRPTGICGAYEISDHWRRLKSFFAKNPKEAS